MAELRRRVTGTLYEASGESREIVVEPGMVAPRHDQLLWIDVGRDEKTLQYIDAALGWTNRLARLTSTQLRPRVVRLQDWTRISVNALDKDAETPKPVAVDIVVSMDVVVSVHDDDLDGLGLAAELVAGAASEFGAFDESAFVAALLDAILAGYFRSVEEIERKIDEFDDRALRAPLEDDLITDLVGLRRQVAVLRRALNPQREVFYTLERPGLVLGDSESAAWPQIADRFREAVETVENARELLVGTFDIVMSRSSERTNDVMRVLTVVSGVLLPAVVVAGVMGMNFQPSFFGDPTNFVIVVAAMITLSLSILLFARFKHWI
jgi:Mg2+ and Co2+ transporter CorA